MTRVSIIDYCRLVRQNLPYVKGSPRGVYAFGPNYAQTQLVIRYLGVELRHTQCNFGGITYLPLSRSASGFNNSEEYMVTMGGVPFFAFYPGTRQRMNALYLRMIHAPEEYQDSGKMTASRGRIETLKEALLDKYRQVHLSSQPQERDSIALARIQDTL